MSDTTNALIVLDIALAQVEFVGRLALNEKS